MKSKYLKIITTLSIVLFLTNCSSEENVIETNLNDIIAPVAGVLTLTENTSSTIKLAWTKFKDNIGMKKISLFSGTTEIFTSTSDSQLNNDFYFNITNLQPNTQYSFILKGYDTSNNEAVSNQLIVTTLKNSNPLPELNLPPGITDETSIKWDETTGIFTFLKNVSFSLGTTQAATDSDANGFNWTVPTQVKKIIIKENVTVIGHFRLNSSITISGENRATSKIYGTPTKKWALGSNGTNDSPNCNQASGDDYAADCQKWQFGAISGNTVNSTYTITDLTIENARTYAVTSFNSKIIMENVHVLNTRSLDGSGDYNSNSDGISAGEGSIVRNCKFDTWDDSIKLYKNMLVENVTIVQNGNGAAFQLGWGSKSATEHTIKNVLIITKNTNYSNLSVISIAGETASIPTKINLGDFKVKIENNQTFRNTGKLLPFILNKSTGNVTIEINQIGSNYKLEAPFGYESYTNQGGNPGGNISVTGTICSSKIEKSLLTINCGNSELITGCGW